jgi:hypothetical protein
LRNLKTLKSKAIYVYGNWIDVQKTGA